MFLQKAHDHKPRFSLQGLILNIQKQAGWFILLIRCIKCIKSPSEWETAHPPVCDQNCLSLASLHSQITNLQTGKLENVAWTPATHSGVEVFTAHVVHGHNFFLDLPKKVCPRWFLRSLPPWDSKLCEVPLLHPALQMWLKTSFPQQICWQSTPKAIVLAEILQIMTYNVFCPAINVIYQVVLLTCIQTTQFRFLCIMCSSGHPETRH